MGKICPKCGNTLDDSAKFCTKCGTQIPPAAQAQQPPQAQQQTQQQAWQQPQPNYSDYSTYSTASGQNLHYVVLQVTLKEKFLGTGSGNLTALEACINEQAAKGYRLHTIATSSSGSAGVLGGDRIQATMVFEKIV